MMMTITILSQDKVLYRQKEKTTQLCVWF